MNEKRAKFYITNIVGNEFLDIASMVILLREKRTVAKTFEYLVLFIIMPTDIHYYTHNIANIHYYQQ